MSRGGRIISNKSQFVGCAEDFDSWKLVLVSSRVGNKSNRKQRAGKRYVTGRTIQQ